jgi:hypothetical protein
MVNIRVSHQVSVKFKVLSVELIREVNYYLHQLVYLSMYLFLLYVCLFKMLILFQILLTLLSYF